MKKLYIFLIIVIVLCVTVGCRGKNGENENCQLNVFQLKRDAYYQFLSEPTMDYLQGNYYSHSTFSISSADTSKIKQEYRAENETSFDESEQGVFRIGNTRVFDDLILFVSDGATLKEYLSNNGVEDKIKNAVIVYTSGLPITVYVDTAPESYFVSINEEEADIYGVGEYTYRLYKGDEYLKKYKPLVAKLEVVGPNGRGECVVKVHSDHASLPILFIMRTLGAGLTESGEKITIEYSGKTFELDIEKYKLVDISNGHDYLILPPGNTGYRNVEENDFVIDVETLDMFFDDAGIKMSFDRTAKCYTVTPN